MDIEAEDKVLRIENVTVEFNGECVLKEFSLEIKQNDKVVIYGISGKGKSTILRLLTGLLIPSRGDVFFRGESLKELAVLNRFRTEIAWLPSELFIPLDLTVEQVVLYPFFVKANRSKMPINKDIVRLFKEMDLEEKMLQSDFKSISSGQKQRVLLISMILLDKKIIILDEPTSALDSLSSDKIISKMVSMKDTTILVASHDKSLINAFNTNISL